MIGRDIEVKALPVAPCDRRSFLPYLSCVTFAMALSHQELEEGLCVRRVRSAAVLVRLTATEAFGENFSSFTISDICTSISA